MGIPNIKSDRRYTYGDYRTWPDDERWELIDGTAYDMSPAPLRRHQYISGQLFAPIFQFLKDKPCEVYAAPFDVLLPAFGEDEEDDVSTVVQPDISVICDEKKLTEKGCTGAPDWIIEILSPYTAKKDTAVKLRLYRRHGVREYWIVDPGNKFVHVYRLREDGNYREEPELYTAEDGIESVVLPGLIIELGGIFPA